MRDPIKDPTHISLNVGHWPDRKRPALTVHDRDKNESHVLAWFVSDLAMTEFLVIAKQGIIFKAEEETHHD